MSRRRRRRMQEDANVRRVESWVRVGKQSIISLFFFFAVKTRDWAIDYGILKRIRNPTQRQRQRPWPPPQTLLSLLFFVFYSSSSSSSWYHLAPHRSHQTTRQLQNHHHQQQLLKRLIYLSVCAFAMKISWLKLRQEMAIHLGTCTEFEVYL